MKKSIPFLTLLLCFSFACNKVAEPQTAENQSTIDKSNDARPQAEERAVCCCNLSVITTVFSGLTICGVLGAGNACSFSPPNCKPTCGVEQTIMFPNKNLSFCYDDDCSICFTNLGLTDIQIRLDCFPGQTLTILGGGVPQCYSGTCGGTLTLCQ